jgi:hypothetical protein
VLPTPTNASLKKYPENKLPIDKITNANAMLLGNS